MIPVEIRVLAHNGGWDEIALVAGPLLVMGGLLWLANKRAKDLNREADPDPARKRN